MVAQNNHGYVNWTHSLMAKSGVRSSPLQCQGKYDTVLPEQRADRSRMIEHDPLSLSLKALLYISAFNDVNHENLSCITHVKTINQQYYNTPRSTS